MQIVLNVGFHTKNLWKFYISMNIFHLLVAFYLKNAFIFFQRNLNILNLLLVPGKALKGYEDLDGGKIALQLLSPCLACAVHYQNSASVSAIEVLLCLLVASHFSFSHLKFWITMEFMSFSKRMRLLVSPWNQNPFSKHLFL